MWLVGGIQFTALLKEVLAPVEGQGANGTWRRQDIIVETVDQYPKKVCVSIWGDKINVQELTINSPYTIDVNLESREYNGRWFTDVKAWKITLYTPSSLNQSESKNLGNKDLSELIGTEDDLPF
jgi:hypothetical protein